MFFGNELLLTNRYNNYRIAKLTYPVEGICILLTKE